MLNFILDVLRELGWIGLLIGIAIEALSFPFPAAIFVLIYGYLLDPGWGEILFFSILTSLFYVLVSFIPYFLSIRYDKFVRRKIPQQKLLFAQKWIDRYGDWMIAVGRFIGMGYITYIAGLGKMSKIKFAGLTFIGFYPLSVLMFYLGTLGNVVVMVERFQQMQWFVYSTLGAIILLYIVFRIYRKKKYDQSNQTSAKISS
ncbi:hypothetical protein CR203_13345 [Salipaludibacillus neizhouensis]|uniref:VTT domain-containing protein n=1 Tax=Salipaludibacillus neizhouensis TaxID=885475 RepID=A0A3A9KGS4_9BACI|nr:VTT domain-containing protein [Salipaludibacillus neizhouensis]RKL66815.1 hypothetical protein CR203_13345 [Salipaludibacillus neizhouensis]